MRQPDMRQRAPHRPAPRRRLAGLTTLAALAAVTAGALLVGPVSGAPGHAGPSPRGVPLWRNPGGAVVRARAAVLPGSAQETLLGKIADQPQGTWVTSSATPLRAHEQVTYASRDAAAGHQVPVFVVYGLPHLDCRQAGAPTAAGYRDWVARVAAGTGRRATIAVLEPDALAMLDCLPPAQQAERLALLRYAVFALTRNPNTAVYLDAGHAGWRTEAVMAARLSAAGVDVARGFSLDVSNFDAVSAEVGYGRAVSTLLGGTTPFVVDVGRSGLGALAGDPLGWCNPPGRALGPRPTTGYPDPLVDALLWVKPPGESDGVCRPGEPPAGAFWTDYAVELAARAAW